MGIRLREKDERDVEREIREWVEGILGKANSKPDDLTKRYVVPSPK